MGGRPPPGPTPALGARPLRPDIYFLAAVNKLELNHSHQSRRKTALRELLAQPGRLIHHADSWRGASRRSFQKGRGGGTGTGREEGRAGGSAVEPTTWGRWGRRALCHSSSWSLSPPRPRRPRWAPAWPRRGQPPAEPDRALLRCRRSPCPSEGHSSEDVRTGPATGWCADLSRVL